MDVIVFNNISYEINLEQLIEKLHIQKHDEYLDILNQLVMEALAVGRPQAVYKMGYIEEKGEDFVIVDGVKFISKVLRVNLAEANRVFPYVITAGSHLGDWVQQKSDIFERFCADAIAEAVLIAARHNVLKQLDEHFGLRHTANMNPGSLTDWPITEQKALFGLLGNVEELIGVRLTKSSLMTPIKSVSGIHFPTEGSWENCQLCPREECSSRRAPYDKRMHEEKYS